MTCNCGPSGHESECQIIALRHQLALARRALAAAEEMRAGEGSPAELAAEFDAAMAEVRKGANSG